MVIIEFSIRARLAGFIVISGWNVLYYLFTIFFPEPCGLSGGQLTTSRIYFNNIPCWFPLCVKRKVPGWHLIKPIWISLTCFIIIPALEYFRNASDLFLCLIYYVIRRRFTTYISTIVNALFGFYGGSI